MVKQEHIPVFYEGQDDLIEILATSMASVCYTTKSFIDFYILDCGICDFNKKLLEGMKDKFDNFSITFLPIDLHQFKGLAGWGSQGVTRDEESPYYHLDCYSRLLIPELVPHLNKVIYLDADIIALNDIQELYNEDLENYELGAACDIGCNDFFHSQLVNKMEVNEDQIYMNAGVLLIDALKWREHNVTQNLLNIARKYKSEITVIIEDILGKYYSNNNYKLLNNRYNSKDRTNEIEKFCPKISCDYLKNEWDNIVLQHLSPGKPWKTARNDYNGHYLKLFSNFWFFAQMTPFFEGMKLKFEEASVASYLSKEIRGALQNHSIHSKKIKIRFFSIPFLSISKKKGKTVYKLFGFIPILKIKKK